MNLLSWYGGHDAAFTVYVGDEDKFYNIELEKLVGVKHFSWALKAHKSHRFFTPDYFHVMTKVGDLLDEWGLPKNYDAFINSSFNLKTNPEPRFSTSMLTPDHLRAAGIEVKKTFFHNGHHVAHAWCAVGQMPPDRGVVITVDGGGDDGDFSISTFDRKKNLFKRRVSSRQYKIGGKLEEQGHMYLDSLLQNTPHSQDLAGKIMGAAGFGNAENFSDLKLSDSWYRSELKVADFHNEYHTAAGYLGETNRFRFLSKNHLTFQEEADRCAWMQKTLENSFSIACKNLLKVDLQDLLKSYGNQLLLSGGVALNIIHNKKLEERFGCNVWVPPNPGDSGLSFGMAYKFLVERKIISFDKTYENSFLGPPVKDLYKINLYREVYQNKSYEIELDDLVNFLKSGKVIALMQGNSECGFRALGARSILCDATFPDIKNRVNEIKRREKYRPFAPMTLWKNASKWFNVGEVNNYKHMNMAVTIKSEMTEQMASITHVDGTARLQTVDDPGFVYNLLEKHGGVLLNTSFNLGGKPICNSLYEGLHILERSSLDYLIVEDHGKLICFEHHRNETV